MSLNLGVISAAVTLDDSVYRKKLSGLSAESEKTFQKIASTAGAYLSLRALTSVMSDGVRSSMAYGKELANISSIAGELNTEKIRGDILNLNSSVGSAVQNAGALYFAYSAGVRGTEEELVSFTGTVSKLAAAIVAENIPTMDAFTSIMNAYGKEVKDAGEISDFFFQIVKQGKTTGSELAAGLGTIAGTAASAGVSLDDLGSALATLTTTMPTARAITSLNGFLAAFVKPTDDAREAAAEFGIELSADAVKSKGFASVIREMNEKIGSNSEALGRIVPNLEGFRAAVALCGKQYGMFANNVELFAKKGGSAEEAFRKQTNNLDAQLRQLPITLEKISIRIGDAIKEIFTLGGVLTPLFYKFNAMGESGQKLLSHLLAITGSLVALRLAYKAIGALKPIVLDFVGLGGKGSAVAASGATAAAAAANTAANTALEASENAVTAAIGRRVAAQTASTVASGAETLSSGSVAAANTAAAASATASGGAHLFMAGAMRIAAGAAAVLQASLGWISLIGTGLALIFTAIVYACNRAKDAANAENKIASEAAEKSRANMETMKKECTGYQDKMSRLEELSKAERLSNSELDEASRLSEELKTKYGDLGVIIERNTGRVIMGSKAWELMSKKQREAMKTAAEAQMRDSVREGRTLESGVYANMYSLKNSSSYNSSLKEMQGYLQNLTDVKQKINAVNVFRSRAIAQGIDVSYLDKLLEQYKRQQAAQKDMADAMNAENNPDAKPKPKSGSKEQRSQNKDDRKAREDLADERWNREYEESGNEDRERMLNERISKLRKDLEKSARGKSEKDYNKQETELLRRIEELEKKKRDLGKEENGNQESLSDQEYQKRYSLADESGKMELLEDRLLRKREELERSAGGKSTSNYTEKELEMLREINRLEQQRLDLEKSHQKAIEEEERSYAEMLADRERESKEREVERSIRQAENNGNLDQAKALISRELAAAKKAAEQMRLDYEQALDDSEADGILTAEERRILAKKKQELSRLLSDEDKWKSRSQEMDKKDLDYQKKAQNSIVTFSAKELSDMVGRNDAALRTAKATEETKKNTRELVIQQRKTTTSKTVLVAAT